MPELPEVENIVRELRRRIINKKVSKVIIYLDKIIKNKKKNFIRILKDSKIKGIERYGKLISINLADKYYLLIHLKICGQLLYLPYESPDKHTHVIFEFKNSNHRLCYRDVRQFGYLKVIKKERLNQFILKRIGPDYLSITPEKFLEVIKARRKIIKSFLLDQKIFSGLGNIYTCESLYLAGIHPKAISGDIKKDKIKKLYNSIQLVLKKAIKEGGSSINDYVHLDSSRGNYQRYHLVYGREGQSCPRCRTKISNIKINNRSSYFCPVCQKL